MPLEGSVGDFGLVDISQLIAMQKKSGVLTISSKNKEDVFVSFLDGAFIRAFSGDENERFADAMISAEKVTIVQLRAALRITPKGLSIASTFVKLYYITAEEARSWNKMLTQEVLFDLLSWKSGSYKFEQAVMPKMDLYNAMSVEWILMEGMRQSDEWPALLKKIPSRDGVYEKVKRAGGDAMGGETGLLDEGDLIDAPGLSKPLDGPEPAVGYMESDGSLSGNDTGEDTGILRFINGVRTVSEITSHAGIGAFAVYKELSALLSEGKIRACEPSSKKESKAIPIISLSSIKELLFDPVCLNSLLIFAMIVLSALFFQPIFSGEKSPFQAIKGYNDIFRELSIGNKRDIIEFSLNLYYLKTNRYPDNLNQLKREGLLEPSISLDDWVYSHNKSIFNLKFKQDPD